MVKALMRHYYRYKLTKHRNEWIRTRLAIYNGNLMGDPPPKEVMAMAEKALAKMNTYTQKLERSSQ